MALPAEPFFELLVESVESTPMSGKHGTVHIHPVPGQGVDPKVYVECAREMRTEFEPGTKFLVTAKYSNRKGGGLFLKAPYAWRYTKVSAIAASRFLKSLA